MEQQTINSNKLFNITNKIPKGLLFNELPDRQQALVYLNYVKSNVPEARTLSEDVIVRAIIAHQLRIVNMKTIEPEILLVIGLRKASSNDLTCPAADLIARIIDENREKYDLDTMQRVLAQIMTKLPRDLRDRVTGRQKLQLFQVMSKFIGIKPSLLENFINYDPSVNDNTAITMELDAGDYATLNKKFLNSITEREQKNLYIPNSELEFANSLKTTIPVTTNGGEIKAQYVDKQPDLMLGLEDKKIYFFDESSGALTEINPNSSKAVPVTVKDLQNLLISQKIEKTQIDDVLKGLDVNEQSSNLEKIYNSLYSSLYGSGGNNDANEFDKVTIGKDMTYYVNDGYLLKKSNGWEMQKPVVTKITPTSTKTPTTTKAPATTNTIPNTTAKSVSGFANVYPKNLQPKQNAPVSAAGSVLVNSSGNQLKKIEGFTSQEAAIFEKMKNEHTDNVENIAIGFVTVIILIFLVVIFNALRD